MPAQKTTVKPSPLHVLCMGGGVQTTTILLMAIQGEYPRPDHVVYADLGWDGPAVRRNIKWLNHKATDAAIPWHVITPANIRLNTLDSYPFNKTGAPTRAASMPFFTLDALGHHGMLRRQCTNEYKIRPIDNYIRRTLLHMPKYGKAPPEAASLWFGISNDEAGRRVTAGPKWKNHVYPLLDLDMSRDDCHEWLDRNNYHHPARSSCIPCPFRCDQEWAYIKTHLPDEFKRACQFDEAIRHPKNIAAELFVHQDRVPLASINFDKLTNKTPTPSRHTECFGYCDT